MTTFIDTVADLMATDDDDRAKQSRYLLDMWGAMNIEERNAVDAIFLCLCGWNLSTLVDKWQEPNPVRDATERWEAWG